MPEGADMTAKKNKDSAAGTDEVTGTDDVAQTDDIAGPEVTGTAATGANAADEEIGEEITDAEVIDEEEELEDTAGSLQVEESEDPLTIMTRERDDYLDALRRLQADFDNYRKRVQRQEQEVQARAAERLISDLLPSLDAFEYAAAHLAGNEDSTPETKALLQAAALLADTLAKAGLERDAIAGDLFDPVSHQAVEHLDSDGSDDAAVGPVIDTVLRSGYRWKGRVLRPAMVKVRG